MENEILDIVSLIENNPITRLDRTYQNKLLGKVKEKFTDSQQKLFISSFYCYLNYSSKDFVVNLDNVWKWVGFNRINDAKRLLVKHFKEEEDYKLALPNSEARQHGGRNKETILMTIKTFKKFCIIAKTKKAREVHDYYLKMEELLQETIEEETEELRIKLLKNTSENEKVLLVNSSKKRLVYLGLVEDNLVKFGYTKNIESRVRTHKKDFESFVLKYTIHTDNYIELEEFIKESCDKGILKDRRVIKEIKGKNQTELIKLDEKFAIDNLYDEVIKLNDILEERRRLGFNETIIRLQKDNKRLREENEEMKKKLIKNDINFIESTISRNRMKKIKNDIPKLKYFLEYLKTFIDKHKGKETILLTDNDFFEDYSKFIRNKYNIIYEFKKQKFCVELLKCPYIVNDRKTMQRDNPNYRKGKDNRIKVKKVMINNLLDKWVAQSIFDE